mgnify:CR=1 FL=1
MPMKLDGFFRDFHSNTLAASGNQSWFETEGAAVVGRVFYRVFAGGEYRYSLLFSDAMDSTFSDGQRSYVNQALGDWEILSARVGVTARAETEGFDEPSEWRKLTFDCARRRTRICAWKRRCAARAFPVTPKRCCRRL